MNNNERFTGKARVYAKYRPSYAPAFIDYLYDSVGFSPQSVIADIGAGTGILTRQLLERGSRVIGVEPNVDMRREAQRMLSGFPGFVSVNATAEDTGLPGHSVDFVTVASAFHWFDPDRFRAECRRILRPGGKVVLVGNRRVEGTALVDEYKRICREWSSDPAGNAGSKDPEAYAGFFRDGACEVREFENNRSLTLDALIGWSLSWSRTPREGESGYRPFIEALTAFFHRYAEGGVLIVPQVTRSYTGEV